MLTRQLSWPKNGKLEATVKNIKIKMCLSKRNKTIENGIPVS